MIEEEFMASKVSISDQSAMLFLDYRKSPVMCDSPLYARNMFYRHWLIKNLLESMAGHNIARLEEM